MFRHSCAAFIAAALLLVGHAVPAAEAPLILIATQTTAPAHLVRVALGHPHLSKAQLKAQLKNDSNSLIVSYRIGWANVHPKAIELRKGAIITVRGIKPESVDDVSDQTVPFDASAERVIFFVAELAFADGSRWKANDDDVEHDASAPTPH